MKGADTMSFVDSLKKGLFGGEDDYDDQYIDDGTDALLQAVTL